MSLCAHHVNLNNHRCDRCEEIAAAEQRARRAPPIRIRKVTAEGLAQQFHETYERLAPSFGYETRKASAKPWSDVPEQNKRLMIAVCAEILTNF